MRKTAIQTCQRYATPRRRLSFVRGGLGEVTNKTERLESGLKDGSGLALKRKPRTRTAYSYVLCGGGDAAHRLRHFSFATSDMPPVTIPDFAAREWCISWQETGLGSRRLGNVQHLVWMWNEFATRSLLRASNFVSPLADLILRRRAARIVI